MAKVFVLQLFKFFDVIQILQNYTTLHMHTQLQTTFLNVFINLYEIHYSLFHIVLVNIIKITQNK